MGRGSRLPNLFGALALALTLQTGVAWGAERSDALLAARPAGGEYFGLYLVDKKVGYLFEDLTLVPGHPNQAQATTELVFRATVGTQAVERRHREVRVYDAHPHGKLLSFTFEDVGDGGDQKLVGTVTPKGITVHRERPGMPAETLELPPAAEMVEDADQARVALLRHARVQGRALDGTDLKEYGESAEPGPIEQRVVGGVQVRLHKVVALSEKDKVPMDGYFTDDGALAELSLGQSMRAVREPKDVAQKLDRVEIFSLTRVVLPVALPKDVREQPRVKFLVSGLPAKFAKDTYRQKFRALPDGNTEVTLLKSAPSSSSAANSVSLAKLPVRAPSGGEQYLESTLAVEAKAPAIQKTARQIVGEETDAYAAARKIVLWVGSHMHPSYGSSADRATDVLRQMKGDCTEHSLLSVALLRAAGIPARRVDGLIYLENSDGVPAFYWHEWVEAWVGEWTQLDPTFHEPVADATHFALGEETSAEITPLLGQLKVLQVL
jgi:hypothetical protein